jgi:hypothetical protein
MGARTTAYWVLVGGTEARRPFENQRVILKCIFKK